LSLNLAASRGIEGSEPLLEIDGSRRDTRRQDPDEVSGRFPFDVVTGPDEVLIGHGFGQGDWQLARDLGHVLTVPRTVLL
jgi:hypothetical protein